MYKNGELGAVTVGFTVTFLSQPYGMSWFALPRMWSTTYLRAQSAMGSLPWSSAREKLFFRMETCVSPRGLVASFRERRSLTLFIKG